MFDFLKGGKAEIQVKLDRPKAIYAPGETIHATVNVQGVKDLKIQGAQIALVAREEYEYRYERRTTDSDGHSRNEESKSRTTDERKVWEKQFLSETTIKGNTNTVFEFDIPLPPNAAPTVDGGKILNLEWLVKTTLARRLASDVENKQEIYILTTPTGKFAGAGDFGFSNEPSDAEMSLRLSTQEYVVGETISGELLIRVKKEFDVTEIRVELMRSEFVPRDLGNNFTESQTVKLAGGAKLSPGQEMTLPFQLKISSTAPITCDTQNGSIDWSLRGILARRMRGDTFAEQEIFVFNGK